MSLASKALIAVKKAERQIDDAKAELDQACDALESMTACFPSKHFPNAYITVAARANRITRVARARLEDVRLEIASLALLPALESVAP